MRCQKEKCTAGATVEIRRHHTAFCNEHFLEFFERQVARAIEHEHMFTRDDRVLVAVSGGKDSLALWDVLRRLGYQTTGLYINLGIGEYSAESQRKSVAYAEAQQAELETGVEVEMVLDMAARGKKQDAHDLFGTLQFLEDLAKVRRSPKVIRFLVAIHAWRTRKHGVFAAHRIERYSGPFAFVIRAGLGSGRHIAQDLEIAHKGIDVVRSGKPDSCV